MKFAVSLAFSVVLGSAPALAEPLPPPAGVAWLQKIASAARKLNYTGTFVYQYGAQVETSRIWHYVDASGEYEKLETLDGPAREVIRNNDEVLCYYPDSKTVKVEKRRPKPFPALVPEHLTALTEYYNIRIGDRERIAGYEAQSLILEPKDGLRYGHKFWADVDTGLLLKARMMNERRETVEQFAFTQLTIGGVFDKEALKSNYNAHVPGWSLDCSEPCRARGGRYRLGRDQLPGGVQENTRNQANPARTTVSRLSYRILGRTRGHFDLHRADGTGEALGTWDIAPRGNQHLQSAAGGAHGDSAGRGAQCNRCSDGQVRRRQAVACVPGGSRGRPETKRGAALLRRRFRCVPRMLQKFLLRYPGRAT